MVKSGTYSAQALRSNIRDLGSRLGRVLAESHSPEFLKEVELVRRWAKDLRRGSRRSIGNIERFLRLSGSEKSFKIARSFTEFLRLANAAEQHHRTRRRLYYETHSSLPQMGSVEAFLKNLKPKMISQVVEKLNQMEVDLVLTSHPTESMRQSAIRRYKHVTQNLAILDRRDSTRWEKEQAKKSLDRNIRALCLTEIVQEAGPTPFTESLSGFSIVEEVLWDAVPRFYRRLNDSALRYLKEEISLNARPIRFSSWVGGDRDGNPYVTAQVTRQVLYKGMSSGYQLILSEVDWLLKEMSFKSASSELLDLVGGGEPAEPYRILLDKLSHDIEKSKQVVLKNLNGLEVSRGNLIGKSEIIEPLKVVYRSLVSIGANDLAQGRTLDLIRRLEIFGVALLSLDIRQSSDVHEEVVAELVFHLFKENYRELNEQGKQKVLLDILNDEKIIERPPEWSSLGREVLDTCNLINDFPEDCFRSYVISMTEEPSDLLEAFVLLKIANLKRHLPVVPLFETPEALKNGRRILESLLDLSYYRKYVGNYQMVMLGYSDSAKRSGRLASAWLLHQIQTELEELAHQKGIGFEFFHGRGGSIGRGGGPIHLALLALPRGSGNGRLRVTEQGETVHGKFGLPGIAERTLDLYVAGVLEAAVSRPPKEKKIWYSIVDRLAEDSSRSFRKFIYENERFISYFTEVTPVQELALFKIGSRPARRKAGISLDSLRAIPWVYSWTQNRGLLPSWFGLGEALEASIARGELRQLRLMYKEWPFFKATLDLLEMVLAKVDISVFKRYSDTLVSQGNQDLTLEIIEAYRLSVSTLAQITGHKRLLEDNPVLRRSISVRTPYVDVLNILQCHFLKIYRENPDDTWAQRILALTISGISAGMRNTG